MPHQVNSNLSKDGTYIGIDLLTEQSKKRSLRKGYTFNLMVAGKSNNCFWWQISHKATKKLMTLIFSLMEKILGCIPLKY